MRLGTIFRNMGFTNNWQVRCPSCGRTVNLRAVGGYRDAPRAIHKKSLGWCRSCRALRFFLIEPVPRHDPD